jgi:signal transduction histidine kinase
MKIASRLLVLVFFFVLTSFASTDKQRTAIDSVILVMPESNQKVDSLLRFLSNIKDTTEARRIFNVAMNLANKLNHAEGTIGLYDAIGVIHRNLSYYNTALVYHRKALEMAETSGNLKLKMKALNNIGVVYRRIDESKLAIDFHMDALKIAEKLNDPRNTCISLNSIGNIYVALGQYKQALTFFRRALVIETQQKNYWGISINLQNIGVVFESENNLDSALHYYKESLRFDILAKKESGIAICYNSIGEVYIKLHKYQEAEEYFRKALAINLTIGDKVYIADSYSNLAHTFLHLGNTSKAIQYYLQSAEISMQIGSKLRSEEAYHGLSECYEAKNDYSEAMKYHKLSVLYRDSIRNENNARHLALLQTQYDTQKQKHQIEILNKEKKTSQLIVALLSIITLAGITVSVFGYRNANQRRKIDQQALVLKEQKIRELEKDQQIIATHAVLQGEETERGRLARDLHDGLGGLLSGIRLTLSSGRTNFLLSMENSHVFDNAITLLDQSIRELRRVAHNMMPETLVKYGLKDALQDFCHNLEVVGGPKITFTYWGEQVRFDRSLETTLYRIAMELINNAVKHSQSNEIMIQLVQETKRLYLTVQDDGIGFNFANIDCINSSGLRNIQARVESFNGRLDIYSKPGEGTEIGVEFKIEGKISST